MNKVQEVMNSKELLYGGKMKIYMRCRKQELMKCGEGAL